jgi:uroporphyrinogen-III synthase
VTRAEGPDGPVSTRLRARGAVPVLRPAVSFSFASHTSELAKATWELESYDWLMLTSSRAVRALAAIHAFSSPRPEGLRVAVVGPGTAAELGTHGWEADVVPESGGAEVMATEVVPLLSEGARVLFPASAAAGGDLVDALTSAGAQVNRVDAYAPAPSPQPVAEWNADVVEGRIDALTFTSPSAVSALASALEDLLDPEVLDRLHHIPAATQGPTTASAARDAGWQRVLVASPTTFDGLVAVLDDHFASEPA